MLKRSPLQHPHAFAEALGSWFVAHARDYPWRRTTDPYAIMVSEMMLQQTQISTVLGRGYYQRWMERFPNVQALAVAPESEVLRQWEGLGYYRRARFLQRMAQVVVQEHGGAFPATAEAILELPGVGRYTAGAVASFAYDAPSAVVDGNVARVLARLCNDSTPVDSPQGMAALWERAEILVQAAPSARAHNGALMELGQTVCKVSTPLCQQCPVSLFCLATDPSSLPVKNPRVAVTEVTERVFFHQSAKGVLLQQEQGPRRTGLWKLPALPDQEKVPPLLHKSRYTITRYRVTLWVHEPAHAGLAASLVKEGSARMVPHDDLAALPMPSPYRRVLNALLADAAFRLEA